MSIMEELRELIAEDYYEILECAVETGDYTEVESRMAELIESDSHMTPYEGEKGTKYYKPFVQTVVPKVIDALKESLPNTWPEIPTSFEEIDQTRRRLGLTSYGSKQDVLYGFTSERYKAWGATLHGMGFTSACMSGVGKMVVTMAPRYLQFDSPDIVTRELEGAIPSDFWQSTDYLLGNSFAYTAATELLELAEDYEVDLEECEKCESMIAIIDAVLADDEADHILHAKATALRPVVSTICERATRGSRRQGENRLLDASKTKYSSSQEQIALKYMEDGKYLQKILNGKRVEHIQSNVKMVKNPLRDNKCEVDSIYRVIGEKGFVFVEAKARDNVSRTQLYQIFETFRLKLPHDWSIKVIALTMSEPSQEQREQQIETIVDLIEVAYDEASFGKITESLLAIKPCMHYRWEIIKTGTAS